VDQKVGRMSDALAVQNFSLTPGMRARDWWYVEQVLLRAYENKVPFYPGEKEACQLLFAELRQEVTEAVFNFEHKE
jgi:hypothetical protein